MAKLTDGNLNLLSGSIGPLVASSWRGIPVLRTRPKLVRSRKPTARQLLQRARFALASKILQQFKSLFEKSFQPVTGQTGMNVAISHLLNQAMSGQDPAALSVDISQLLVAKGALKKAEQAVVLSTEPGRLTFSWANNTGSGNAQASDKVILVAYDANSGYILFSTGAANRVTGQGSLNVSLFLRREVHTWISFRSESGEMTADSVYCGVVQVAG